MSEKSILHILTGLEDLNNLLCSDSYSKIKIFEIDSTSYGVLLCTICRISFLKLNIDFSITGNNSLESFSNNHDGEKFKLCVLNVFCLSFDIIDIICTSKNIWVIGHKAVLDLKPYIELSLKNAQSADHEECMDIDEVEEFNPEIFDINIEAHELKNCEFQFNDVFIGSNFIDCGFVVCHRDIKQLSDGNWNLNLVSFKRRSSEFSTTLFLDFPLSFSSNSSDITLEDERERYNPFVTFIHYNDPERLIFEKLFGVRCPPSQAICFVGNSDGKLLWCFCDCESNFQSCQKLETLHDSKQPIIGVYFLNNFEGFKDSGFMLIVGVLGQITVISAKKLPSFTFIPGLHPFWVFTVHLKSSVTGCIVVNNCLLHHSNNGMLWITELPKLLASEKTNEEFHLASNFSDLSSVEQMFNIGKEQGLILLKTNSGNLYVALCLKEIKSTVNAASLPLLMNECLAQSTLMKELLQKKVLQSKLFAALSTFASIKFSENILDEPVTFSLSKLNMQPRKYLLVLNFKCLEKLHLNSELCFVSVSVSPCDKNNNSVISKTVPYTPDEPTLCLELTDTVLQSPTVSVFPLLVEMGLILQLPDSWRIIDCFEPISKCLPFYLRIQTFMVHELHLFQNTTLCSPQSLVLDKPKILTLVKELGMKRPISSLLQLESINEYKFPIQFDLCLSSSTVEEMIKGSTDTDPCEFIQQLLTRNRSVPISSEDSCKTFLCPFSAVVAKNGNTFVVTLKANSFDSLIDLRIAVKNILLSQHNQSKCIASPSTYVNIPASIYRRCEEISKTLMDLYGKDVETSDVTRALLQLYQELRTDVTGKLPIF